MATNPQKPKKKRGGRIKSKNNPKEVHHQIMQLRWTDKKSYQQIAEIVGLTKSTVASCIMRNEHRKHEFLPAIVVAKQLADKRLELPGLKRLEAIASDTAQVVELSIMILKQRLENEINEMSKPAEERLTTPMSHKELKEVIETVTPYVMPKKIDAQGAKKKDDVASPKGQLFNMFNQPVQKQAK